jgi:PAS domain S-box-containing protein
VVKNPNRRNNLPRLTKEDDTARKIPVRMQDLEHQLPAWDDHRLVFGKRLAMVRRIAEILTVAILYYVTGKLGRTVAPPPGIATVVWPPSGIALAALLIFGNRVWPGIWIGAFLVNNWQAFDPAHAREAMLFLVTGAAIDTGSLLQSLAGAALFRRFIGMTALFDRFKNAVIFIGIALVMCLIGSIIGVVSLRLGGVLPWGSVPGRWWTWWIGDTAGVLVMTPLILTWWRLGLPEWDGTRWMDAIGHLVGAALVAMAIFVWWQPPIDSRYPADLLFLPLVAWVAYRFTQRESTLIVLVVLTIAVWGTIHGSGPYRGTTPWIALPEMQAFIGILSILSVTIGAVITERKEAIEALSASEHWLRESQRISRIGSYVFDLRSGKWSSSEILDEIFGIGPGYPRDLDGWAALVHPEDRQGMIDYFRNEVIGNGRDFHREYRIVRPSDGEVRWVLGRGELSFDGKKAVTGMAGTILDSTERRSMEAQLLQAQKMESIGRLAGGVAHDFNNLLTVINGYGDLVLSKLPAESPVYQQVREIRRAGDRAAELTMQLLAFSRKQVLRPKVLNLNDIVRDSDKMLRRIIGEDVELVCLLDPELRAIEADPGQLHQVIVNLAVNARDAMPEGGKLIIETANSQDIDDEISADGPSGNQVRLSVIDTGHGMDAVTMEHAFEPFFTTKGVGKGTGLGLAMVYGIVRQSGGRISVRSEPGRGAMFTVLLPAVEGVPAMEEDSEPAPMGSETVLLVEDEAGVRRLIANILEKHGYRVFEAAGGEEAVRMYATIPYRVDLLVTDVVMPRMKGPELASSLRTYRPEIPVLFISGYTDPSIGVPVGFSAGSHYLQKPFAAADLVRAVREALDSRQV